jgi:HK97 gp10 family phage protein
MADRAIVGVSRRSTTAGVDLAGVSVVGLDEVLRDLRKLQDKEIPKAIRTANYDAAKLVVPTARGEAPKRTGKLAASVSAKATTRVGSVKAGSRVRVPYAGPIHFGWWKRHIKPNPFLYRAVDKRIGDVYRQYEKQLEKAIARFNHG